MAGYRELSAFSGEFMNYVDKNQVIYQLDPLNEPICSVVPDSVVVFRTCDCFNGRLLEPGSVIGDINFDEVNPATGPVFVEGAEPGDTLKIEVLQIKLDAISVMEIDRDFGVLASLVQEPQIKYLPVEEGGIRFSDRLHLCRKAMIGVIGVAPSETSVPTNTPDIHGGNMDCTQITEGSVLYLPVFAKGALLSLGDLHACMGEGEIGGCGAEVGGEVTLRLSVVKAERKLYPVVVTKEQLHVIGAANSVEEAWEKAVKQMHQYLNEETELTSDEAVMLLSLAGDLTICQTVNPNKTVRMSIPLYCLRAYGWEGK